MATPNEAKALTLLGPPSVGKGTQARRLAEHFGLAHLSTRDRFARATQEGTAFGIKAKSFAERGELMPDEEVVAFVRQEIGAISGGFILDGFPRTLGQAKALDDFHRPDGVFYLQAPDDVIIDRITARLVCACGRSYGPEIPPRRPYTCDVCSKTLFRRPDDEPEVVARRLEEYNGKTRPLLHHYRDILHPINANNTPDKIFEQLSLTVAHVLHKKG
jgi:adenylate kinase